MENNIKIISKYSVIKEFNSPEEFDKYYLKHKEEINNKTTNQLNKEYKIKDYKITKRNIKIIDNNTVSGPEWANEIQEMKNKINLLTESYNEILNILNNLN